MFCFCESTVNSNEADVIGSQAIATLYIEAQSVTLYVVTTIKSCFYQDPQKEARENVALTTDA